MDILEILSENIDAKDNNAINKLIDHYTANGLQQKSKVMFSSFLMRMFCQHYLNRNLWSLREFSRLIASVESAGKDKGRCIVAMKSLCYLLSAMEHKDSKPLIDTRSKSTSVYEKSVVERLLFTAHKEYADLVDIKEYINGDCYALINVLYHNIAYVRNVQECIHIMKHLIVGKKKEFLNHDYFTDTIDLLFVVLMKYVENNRLPTDVSEFIHLCKDLFYYRLTLKEKPARINLLIYALYILLQRKTKYQEINDYIPKDIVTETRITDKRENAVDYLYVITYYDNDAIESVKNDRYFAKLTERKVKSINVKEWIDERDASITVIRESYDH